MIRSLAAAALMVLASPTLADPPVYYLPDTPEAERMSMADLFKDNRYWPPPCHDMVCPLTGLGGIVGIWEGHVRMRHNDGMTFVVQGACMSACELAVREAQRIGATIAFAPGATLWVHTPYPMAR